MLFANDKLGMNCERNVEKMFFSYLKIIYTGTKQFFPNFSAQYTPICHLPAAGDKIGISRKWRFEVQGCRIRTTTTSNNPTQFFVGLYLEAKSN
jgi:hypothetical protein